MFTDDFKPQIITVNNSLYVTSLAVATHFKKEHKNVLRDIRETLAQVSDLFNALNFEPVNYLDIKGENRPMYHLTRDGFMILVMGYTGKEAMRIKETYILAFNQMEAILHSDFKGKYERLARQVFSVYPKWQIIRNCYQAGLSQRQIARVLRCTPATVRREEHRMRQCGLLIQKCRLNHP